MNEKLFCLEAIQRNIRRYGWQAWGTRMMAFAVAGACLLASALTGSKPGLLQNVLPVVMLFLLWLLDGHYKQMQKRYIELFAQTQKQENKTDLVIHVPDKLNVAAMWRPVVALPYLIMIGIFAVVALR